MKVGAATRIINCRIGDELQGQLHRRFCKFIRDDMEANIMYLENGKEKVLLFSLDLIGSFQAEYLRGTCSAIAAAARVPAGNVIIASTHTHEGPTTYGFMYDSVRNYRYLGELRGLLADGAMEAVAGAGPAKLGWGLGKAHIGFNRRVCWADGTHTMYGDTSQPGFAGLEGPDDPSHAVLVAKDGRGRLIAVLHNNSCHATCMEMAEFASADFPGEARALLRKKLGADLPVLYLQGASGDLSPWNLMKHPQRYDGEKRVREAGRLLADETLRLVRKIPVTGKAVLRHAVKDIAMPVRLPTSAELAVARRIRKMGEKKAGRWDYIFNVDGVLRLYQQFRRKPVDTVPVHVVRIGDFAVVTNPCELYCQFGLDIKRRSHAAVTAVSELTGGYSGYCPTIPAIMGGGYSGQAMHWCRLEHFAGHRIVETSAQLLNKVWA